MRFILELSAVKHFMKVNLMFSFEVFKKMRD